MLSIAERHKYILDKLEKYGFIRITDVAEEMGFSSIHYFSRKFKAVTGMTPTEYSRKYRPQS